MQLEQALAEARKNLESENAAEMEQAAERLTKASHKLAEVMYSQQQGGAAPGGPGGPAGGPGGGPGAAGAGSADEVIDAEYVEK